MRKAAMIVILILLVPLTGTLVPSSPTNYSSVGGLYDAQLLRSGNSLEIPQQIPVLIANAGPWWTYTALDSNRNSIHDSLETYSGLVGVGLSYDHLPTHADLDILVGLGLSPVDVIESIDAVLLGRISVELVPILAQLDGVVMVERYGEVVFYGDVQTQAVKARNSSVYPDGAWQFGVTGKGINIAMTDTGVDNEHPGLVDKFVAGYDAVCYLHTDIPECILAGFGAREDDGSFDPDDGNQHGTACIGMASATGLEADGSQSEFYGSAPDASLIDVRIGTDAGAGPFENYFLSQEFYESAMNGLQWIIDHKDTEWAGVNESLFGIDIISLSWGITSHEAGGSDGEDMHSRILNEATEAGVAVSVAAGNDGPDNDGLSGMGSSSISMTIAATDDQNTIDRSDDTIAGYSSRGPRRDNGDGNPYNELKPELSAPGSNIIQAEGCVTTGSCNNNIGQDASGNTYTGRGSGTSYATPAVSGVIALIMEANPDLDPMVIKEVLKQTAERRGEASVPDVDPYWNRDFGYGMIDARAAVELALQINQSGVASSDIDVTLQNHIIDVNTSGGVITISGHAWSQSGIVNSIEFSIEGGDWAEVTYEIPLEEMVAGQPFNWSISLLQSKVNSGNQSIEIRSNGDDGQSLPVLLTVMGTGGGLGGQASSPLAFMLGLIALVGVAGAYAFYQSRIDQPDVLVRAISQEEKTTKTTSNKGTLKIAKGKASKAKASKAKASKAKTSKAKASKAKTAKSMIDEVVEAELVDQHS